MADLIRILTVDDHMVVRRGLAAIIAEEDDMAVVASATNGLEAIEEYRRHRPDVVLMDLQLPKVSGLEAIEAIRAENADARIVVLTMYRGDEDCQRALRAGAAAYLLKDTIASELVHVIREVCAGKVTNAADLLASHRGDSALTARETQLVELLGKGMRNKEIASAMSITEETVQTHLKSIFAKLQVHDRTAALAAAVRRGIVHLE